MAGAAPTTKPAPFLRPLDVLDRGVLLAESSLSLVTVALMLFAAVAESAGRVISPWSVSQRALLWGSLWLFLVGMKLSGPPDEPSPAEGLIKRFRNVTLPRRTAVFQTIIAFTPIALGLGFLTESLARWLIPYASDVLMHGTLWAAFLGASFATRERKHLAIDALSRLFPDRGRRAMVGLSATLGAFVAFALAMGLYDTLLDAAHQANEALRQNQANGVNSPVDRSYEFQFVIPGGFFLIGLRLILHAFHEFVAALAGYTPPKPSSRTDTPDSPDNTVTPADGNAMVAAAHEGLLEPPKEPPAIERATVAEVFIALGALAVLVFISAGTTTVRPIALMSLLAAAVFGIPVLRRKTKLGSWAPPRPDPIELPKGTIGQFIGAALAVIAILAVMRYGLVPNLRSIPVTAGVIFFALMALIGSPLFSFLGGMGLFLFVKFFLADPDPMRQAHAFANSVEDILGNHFARMSVLATIPLFTLAGYLMSESRMPQRLVRVSRALLGWMPGGLAVVCIFASAFFTVFSGASGITIVAVGGLLVPALLRDKYPEKFSLGLVTTGGALGITIPPCLPLIVYGIVAGLQEPAPGQERLELQKFMLVGLVPGLITMGLVMVFAVIIGAVTKVPRSKFDFAEARAALWEAKWELLLPVVLLVGLAEGIFNPSQAAAFTAFYVLVMEVFVYRDLTIREDLPRIVPESMVLVGAIFVKLCAATILVGYFVQAQIADRLFEALTCGAPARAFWHAHPDFGSCREAVDALSRVGQSAGGLIDSKISFLLALNVFLLVIGMLMDIFSAIVVVVPLIAGIALHFDINPYHLGIVFLLNLEIGYLMPPMGLNLFIAGFRFNRPVPDLYRMVLPFIGIFMVALMIITYVPELTTFTLPKRPVATQTNSPTAATPTTDNNAPGETFGAQSCDVPGDNESFEAFQARCSSDSGASGESPEAPAADCDLPRHDESFEAFQARCHPPTEPADTPPADTTPVDAGTNTSTDSGADSITDAH